MKKLIITALALSCIAFGYSQHETVLEEVKLGFAPLKSEVTQNGNSFVFKLNNFRSHDFIYNPVGFLKQNFDIKNFIAGLENKDYDSYDVLINSSKGSLSARYDGNGELLTTTQKFKDIRPPRYIMAEILKSHNGWVVTQVKYFASTNDEMIVKEQYKIKVQNGKKQETVRIDGRKLGLGVATNMYLD